MQLGAMLDLLIGLAFMFFLLALIASSLQEMIAGLFNWRGTYLAKGLDVILDNKGNAAFNFTGIADWLCAHFTSGAGRGVLAQYYRDIGTQKQFRIWVGAKDYPANSVIGVSIKTATGYIVPAGGLMLTSDINGPDKGVIGTRGQLVAAGTVIPKGSKLSAGTVLPFNVAASSDLFTTQTMLPQQQANPALVQVLAVQSHPLLRSTPSSLPSYVPAGNFSTALLGVLRDGSQAPLFTQVQNTISALPSGDLKTTLTLFVQDAGGDIDAFRVRLEKWFDDAMDRLSGIYKRLAQWTMLIIGVGLAVSLNVSATHVAAVLWTTPSQRDALLAQASATVAVGKTTSSQEIQDQFKAFETLNLPIGWDCQQLARLFTPKLSDRKRGAVGPSTQAPTTDAATRKFPDPKAAASQAGTPVSPADAALADPKTVPACQAKILSLNWWVPRMKVAGAEWYGWLITGFAVSFGAPFWFELLQSLVNLRNAGPKAQRADASGVGP